MELFRRIYTLLFDYEYTMIIKKYPLIIARTLFVHIQHEPEFLRYLQYNFDVAIWDNIQDPVSVEQDWKNTTTIPVIDYNHMIYKLTHCVNTIVLCNKEQQLVTYPNNTIYVDTVEINITNLREYLDMVAKFKDVRMFIGKISFQRFNTP